MSKDILSVENITMQFGGVVAVNNLSLHIPEGQIVALIGPNGAGKTRPSTASPAYMSRRTVSSNSLTSRWSATIRPGR